MVVKVFFLVDTINSYTCQKQKGKSGLFISSKQRHLETMDKTVIDNENHVMTKTN